MLRGLALLDSVLSPGAARRARVCAMPTPKKMAPSSSRLLGEVWKNLDEIFGSPFQPYKIGLFGIGCVTNVPQ